MSAYIPLACAIFGIFVAIILVVTFPVSCCSLKKEGFQDTNTPKVKCPRGTKTYTTLSGDTMCCQGNVEGNKCEGKVLCTLSGNSSDKVPTCAKLRQEYLAKLQSKCPASAGFTSYEDEDTGNKGCAAQTTADRNQPQTPATSFCRLYDDKVDNHNYPDSCQNFEKNFKFNTVFTNSARPNFCLDVDAAKPINDIFMMGMAPCNGSDGQAFSIDDKGHVISKKGGILVFENMIYYLNRDNKRFDVHAILSNDPKVGWINELCKMMKIPSQNGFRISNLNMNTRTNQTILYGLSDKNNNGYITNTTKNEDIVVKMYDKNANQTSAAIEWGASRATAVNKPGQKAPQGYYWQCNLNKY